MITVLEINNLSRLSLLCQAGINIEDMFMSRNQIIVTVNSRNTGAPNLITAISLGE